MDDEVTEIQVHASAQRILAARDHSVSELRKKLKKREFPPDLIESVLNDFLNRRWLDDERFAELQSDSLIRQLWGPLKIVAKLVKHGVDPSLARRAVADADVDWEERATLKVEKRFGGLTPENRDAVIRYLKQRGFYTSTISSVVFD